jgi:hypothetical protein
MWILEFLWEGAFALWRAFIVLMIISIIGGAVVALWERFADPNQTRQKKRKDWRDDFR